MGHLTALQRSSRADVPDGSVQPKLQFTMFFPTADFFRVMRINQASLDLVSQFGVDPDDNGLERFLTATRRQNYGSGH